MFGEYRGPRQYPDGKAWKARYGEQAECIGTEWTCRRPRDSADLEACVGCPYLVIRPEASCRAVLPHPEGGKGD
jgi:hypothetical protein